VRTLTDAVCEVEGCTKPPRAAIKVVDGTRRAAVLYFDDREAPKVARPVCKEHLAATAVALILDMVADA